MRKVVYEKKDFKVEGYHHPDLNCARIKIVGNLTGDELLNEAIFKINEFFETSIESNLRNRIIDFSESLLHASYDQMNLLAKRNQDLYEKHPGAKVVIVARKDLTFGEFRMYDVLRSDNDDNIRTVVRTLSEAKEWLTKHSS